MIWEVCDNLQKAKLYNSMNFVWLIKILDIQLEERDFDKGFNRVMETSLEDLYEEWVSSSDKWYNHDRLVYGFNNWFL